MKGGTHARPFERGRAVRWLIALMTLLVLAPPAWAADPKYGSDGPFIIALREKPVFVDPAAGVPAETEGVLLEQLNPTDGIVVLLFGEGAGDPATIAADVNKKLGGKRIVGVTVGDQAAGFSTILPYGVATELMKRAATVSTSKPETLGTFIQNVHDWQRAHPNAPAAKPVKEKEGGLITPMRGILFALVIVVIAAIIVAAVISSTKTEDGVTLKKSPDRIKEQLELMLKLRDKIEDSSMRVLITQIASDVEAFFRRTKAVDVGDRDALVNHLASLNKVLAMYVDVQDNERYFRNPNELLSNGYDATSSFAEFVLGMVQREGRRSITDFRVDTNILSAKKYEEV